MGNNTGDSSGDRKGNDVNEFIETYRKREESDWITE